MIFEDCPPEKLIHLRHLDSESRAIWERDHRQNFEFLSREVVIRRDFLAEQPPWEQVRLRAIAAGMSVYRAVVVGKSAARIWRMPILRDSPTTLCLPGGTHVPAGSQWFPGTKYVNWKLPDHDITEVDGVRVAIRSRVIFDVTRYSTLAEGLALMDETLRMGHATPEKLSKAMERFAGLPGMKKVRRALELADGRSESPLESDARAQLIEAKITCFEIQVRLLNKYRVDFLLDGFLVVEIDGKSKYSSREDLLAEKRRTDDLVNAGYQVLRITSSKLTTFIGNETAFIREVRRRLALGEPVQRRPA